MSLTLQAIVDAMAIAFRMADGRSPQHISRTGRAYRPGIGPHSENAAVALVLAELREVLPETACGQFLPYPDAPRQKCDVWIGNPAEWAIEVKMARFRGAGMASATDVTTAYTHQRREVYSQLILPAMLSFPEAAVAQAAAIPRPTINGLRSGRRPDRGTLRRLVPALAQLCRESAPGIDERDLLAVLAAWRDRQPNPRVCPACGEPPPAGRLSCRAACRQAAYRRRLSRVGALETEPRALGLGP